MNCFDRINDNKKCPTQQTPVFAALLFDLHVLGGEKGNSVFRDRWDRMYLFFSPLVLFHWFILFFSITFWARQKIWFWGTFGEKSSSVSPFRDFHFGERGKGGE